MSHERLSVIRHLVRAGKLGEARALVQAMPTGKLDRAQRLQLAFLSSAAYCPAKALQLLARIVRPDRAAARRQGATAEECIEYANALVHLGAIDEALALLRTVETPVSSYPRFCRVLAFACFRRWDWEPAIPHLERALGMSDLSLSDRLILKSFLGAALMHGRGDHKNARIVLRSCLAEAKAKEHYQVRWDTAQLLAQSSYLTKDWEQALRYLERAQLYHAGGPTELPLLGIDRYRCLVNLHYPGRRAGALKRLATIQGHFVSLGAWEHARSSDYYRAIALSDEVLLAHLIYGTPYPQFRARLLNAFGSQAQQRLPAFYEYKLGPAGRRCSGWLEAGNGENSFRPHTLKPGQLPQKLLAALCSDFYARPTMAQLHAALHPGEYYNPDSSPGRVWYILKGLREFIAREKIPLSIRLSNDRCVLEASQPIVLRIRKDERASKAHVLANSLRRQFGGALFRASEVEALLQVSRPTAVSLLTQVVGGGLAVKVGNGPRTRYQLTEAALRADEH